MDAIKKEDLIPVRSNDEVDAGMTLVERKEGDRYHAFVVLRVYLVQGSEGEDNVHEIDGSPCPSKRYFIDSDDSSADLGGCYCPSIDTGDLYRLRPLEDAEQEKERESIPADRVLVRSR